ncbi:hypothetical protein POV27_09430 [Aureisphaera galaxeae]|uniref:hypothetical protein n=1 Tax=Aureisphaera galaxeae TaxID=1538023 RepID=UPI0023503921|nr:hypothetical protein [Aureisphaera galaxeae]MDC8004271.1 hypothetical protein [Aureisphaera galaxeae]
MKTYLIIGLYSQIKSITPNTNSLNSWILSSIIIIGFAVIGFAIYSGKRSNNNDPHPLGLPAGSIRATMALSIVILFVLLSLFFFNNMKTEQKDMAENVLAIIGVLVTAISSFYFGIKATEQGSKIAKDVFQDKALDEKLKSVSALVIQKAIAENKDTWKEKYNALDIKLGKKESGNTQFELNCILFIVENKTNQSDKGKRIPPILKVTLNSVEYSIPTDVKED